MSFKKKKGDFSAYLLWTGSRYLMRNGALPASSCCPEERECAVSGKNTAVVWDVSKKTTKKRICGTTTARTKETTKDNAKVDIVLVNGD